MINSGHGTLIFKLIIAAFAFAWTGHDALAEGAVFNTPIYDPASKSYFELVRLTRAEDPTHYVPSMNWAQAHAYARQRKYKGAQGRLAVIRSIETHSLILTKLRPSDYTWIGLRYFCNARQLQWSDGQVHSATDFKVWHRVWDQSAKVGCAEGGYMPVAYTAAQEGFRWVAKGGAKLYRDLLIEYPTGGP